MEFYDDMSTIVTDDCGCDIDSDIDTTDDDCWPDCGCLTDEPETLD